MPQFQEYRQQVLQAYQEQKRLGKLSLNLKRPTPAHLREECLDVLASRYLKTDDSLLKDFFGNQENMAAAIRQIDIDKFKPLVNYLEGKTKTTEDKNVELLAWLIDFKSRPFKFDYQDSKQLPLALDSDQDENIPLTIHEFTPRVKKESVINHEVEHSKRPLSKRNSLWGIGIALVISMVLGFLYWSKLPKQQKGCMYWNGQHYVQIDCEQQLPNIQAIALDTFQLHQQFKMLRPDTLNQSALQKLWYSKIDKQIEFFNIGGPHPEHPGKYLKPMTDYIINKYITKRNNSLDSLNK